MAVELVKVTKDHYKFLFELLKERKPEQNISHKVMPTWEEHVKFNERKPYKYDYVIVADGKEVGRIYVCEAKYKWTTINELGIFISDKCTGKGCGSKALDLLLEKHKIKDIHANVAPLNTGSQEFFYRHHFKVVQYTFKRDDELAKTASEGYVKAIDYLKSLSQLPWDTENNKAVPSNSVLWRWLERGSVEINGLFPKPNDLVAYPIRSLRFFPKGNTRTYA